MCAIRCTPLRPSPKRTASLWRAMMWNHQVPSVVFFHGVSESSGSWMLGCDYSSSAHSSFFYESSHVA